MTNLNTITTTQDERIMAALAHISTLIPFIGAIAPIVIWVTQREKSKYVAFQSLQAVVFQLTMFVAYFIGMFIYVVSFFGAIVFVSSSSSLSSSQSANPSAMFLFIIPFLVIGAIFIGGAFFILYGILASIMTFQGKPFRYIIIGNRIERYMQQNPNPPAKP